MTPLVNTPANTAQIDYWNAQAGKTWSENQERLDRQLDGLGRAAQAVLAPAPGERLLDLGCGCGQTTLELALAAGPSGHLTGVDISAPMLEVARARPRPPAAAPVVWRQADAQTADLGEAGFDAAFSRFGVMFFADPVVAFTNIGRAVRSKGRMAFVCWRPLAENLWMRGPLEAAAPLLPPSPPADPHAPGPFAFADPDRPCALLTTAGWRNISVAPHDAMVGAGDIEETLAMSLKVGPLGAALRESPDLVLRVTDRVRAFLEGHVGDRGVELPAAVWLIRAERP